MEKLGLRGIEVFGFRARFHRTAAEGDDPARTVVDREHHAVLEPVIGHGDVVAVDQQPRLDHLRNIDALGRERLAQTEFVRRREAELEGALRGGVDAAIGEVAPRARAGGLVEVALEKVGGERQHFVQARAGFFARDRLRVLARHVEAGFAREFFDRLGKRQSLDLDQKGEDVAALARGEVVVELFLIVDVERRRLLGVERRQPAPFPALLLELDALADDLARGQPRLDLVQKLGRIFHGAQIGADAPPRKRFAAFVPVVHRGDAYASRLGRGAKSFRTAGRGIVMMEWPRTLALAGAGKMGGAMLRGWLDAGLDAAGVAVVEPHPSPELLALRVERGFALNPAAPSPPDALVLAVKPQALAAVAPTLQMLAGPGALILSVIAGKTIADLSARFPQARAFVRVMPNTPAAVGRGASAGAANAAVSQIQRGWTENLMRAVGMFAWVDDEALIDAVTALSGSGPAYVFALVEAMAKAGEAVGLPADLAMRLARATAEGAGELMAREPAISAATLRQNVTSPGGTTAAALAVLQGEAALDALLARAVAAARDRARELGG